MREIRQPSKTKKYKNNLRTINLINSRDLSWKAKSYPEFER